MTKAQRAQVFSVWIVILVSSLLAFPSLLSADPGRVSLQEVIGDVQMIRVGEAQGRAAVQGDLLNPEDQIKTGKDSSAKVAVEGAGEINISKETTWSYDRYDIEGGQRQFSAYLALGRLKAKVQKLPEGSAFQVRTPTSVAAVRGTAFGLFVYMIEQQFFTALDVYENSVSFSNLAGDQEVNVSEHQSATGNESGEVTPPQTTGAESDKALGEEKKGEFMPPSGGASAATREETLQSGASAPKDGETIAESDESSSEEMSPESTMGSLNEDLFQNPPETIQQSEPGQPELQQETQGSQQTVTGSTEPEVKVEPQHQGSV